MKIYKRRLMTVMLGISMMGVSLVGSVSTGYAKENGDSSVQGVQSEEDGQEQGLSAGPEKKENSWRYEDGSLMPQVEAFSNNPDAWKKVNGSFLDGNGNVIEGATKRGVDVSEHQGQIDWGKVKADGIDYAILRCGYGDDFSYQDDKQWQRNVSECERLGIPYGVYLYSYATDVNMAQSEANHTLRLLRGHNLAYPVYLDMEDESTRGVDKATLGKIAKIFCDTLSGAGYKVGIYANLDWWTTKLTDPVFNNPDWSKWVAQYNATCDYIGDLDMWQYTSGGRVNGINGNADMDFWIDSSLPFTDVGKQLWCYDAVEYLYRNGIMTGLNPTTFGPSENLSRAQFSTMLYRMAGSPQVSYSPQFPDVADGQFYTSAVMWTAQTQIADGYENGSFGPTDNITREQMALMLFRYAKYRGYDTSARTGLDQFPDGGMVSSFAHDAVSWSVSEGIINGNGNGTLAPASPTDRAACATMVMRYLTKIEK